MGRTPEELAEWGVALDEGYSVQHVAETFRVAKATVRKHFPGRGWTRKQIIEHAALVRLHNQKMRKMAYA